MNPERRAGWMTGLLGQAETVDRLAKELAMVLAEGGKLDIAGKAVFLQATAQILAETAGELLKEIGHKELAGVIDGSHS